MPVRLSFFPGCRAPFTLFLRCLVLFALTIFSGVLQAQRVAVSAKVLRPVDSGTSDSGAAPSSQPMELTVRFAVTADRSAALDQLLANQRTSSSASYHQWLTPQQFASQFGATDDQIEATKAWFEGQGFTVKSVSPAKTRMTVSGFAAQVESSFAVSVHQYQTAKAVYYANTTQPSVPQEMAQYIAGVSGMNNLPAAVPVTVGGYTNAGPQAMTVSAGQDTDALSAASSMVDANSTPILMLSTAACSTDFTQSDYDAYHDLFRQANAQGITVLATSGCGDRGTGSFPASLGEVTALAVSPTASTFVGIAARPAWQSAPGLPEDGSRDEPDLTTSSINDFAQTLTTILQRTGTRQGNINSTLYALAPEPGLYTQPDATASTPAGSWEETTGLGVVDLAKLAKDFPAGTVTTTTSLQSTNYTPGYGQSFGLSSFVQPSSTVNGAAPTGTVTFVTSQGVTIGSASLVNGTATFNVTTLNVGTYTLTANYSGDANYAASSSTSNVIVTVTIVNATLAATISPATNVPYGANATITATVTLPNSSAAPSGTVSAQIISLTGATFTSTLSPNPGGNSATANINIQVPPPNASYNIQVTCAGNQNFQCQTPVNIPFTTVKGNTLTSLTVASTTPQAGQPVALTAVVTNSGNGLGSFVFTGNITFYDNGKAVATAPVGNNQATANVAFTGNVTHNIVAMYSGDANWNASGSSAQTISPVLIPSAITLTSNVIGTGTTLAGVNVTFTATISSSVVSAAGPTGIVTFYDTYNGTVVTLGSPALTANGPNQSIAILSTTGLLGGMHSVYAVYGGDPDYASSTSSPLSVTLGDYSLTMNPQNVTISRGQNGQVAIQLAMLDGFSGTVSFSCSAPGGTEIGCSFSPASLTSGGLTTMTVSTTAPAQSSTSSAQLGWRVAAGTSLAMLFCFAVPGRRRSLPKLLLLLCALGVSANFGCGNDMTSNNQSSGSSDSGTPLGTQIITITAAGTEGGNTVRHTYQYQVTVQ